MRVSSWVCCNLKSDQHVRFFQELGTLLPEEPQIRSWKTRTMPFIFPRMETSSFSVFV